LGAPRRDRRARFECGDVLHGTGGSGRNFWRRSLLGNCLGRATLDTAKYYIILPDGIGHGKSSKPSDGLHAKFPQYDYDDMVAAHHALLSTSVWSICG